MSRNNTEYCKIGLLTTSADFATKALLKYYSNDDAKCNKIYRLRHKCLVSGEVEEIKLMIENMCDELKQISELL